VGASAAALARLKSLKEVTLEGCTPLGLLAQVSSLTELILSGSYHTTPDWVTAAAHNPELHKFRLSGKIEDADRVLQHDLPADQLEQLLAACPTLTDLDLRICNISQECLDLLLALGTCITSLTVRDINVGESRANAPCQWEKLTICAGSRGLSMHQAAFLPLKTVHQLGSTLLICDLQLPLSSVPLGEIPALLHQAATNLAGCPARQHAHPLGVCLWNATTAFNPLEHRWTSEQRVQLLRAIAPLRHPHLTGFVFAATGWELGQPEVTALHHSFGAGLATLQLGYCTLLPSFWAALNERLPNVTNLRLASSVDCQASDVIISCSKRSAVKPLRLDLGKKLYKACGGDQVQASLRAQGVGHVSITEWER
jgi:hypothetical protein